ncbi:hypothetical protein TSAR_010741 [Trichomalopsis sarcophagae]|uniref:Uncharacterized protein n=1 Tax=Trichomalopsis sarcophagae TaxID=543379 RepID=A0A232EZL1_9HYME|nr:hypothetical protein TSAR_010741 [Trichomalopsis sarcophagae]
MRAKSTLANNYLTTNDIKPGALDSETAACLTGHKVYLNKMLSQEKFSLFKSLRSIAQGLCFKYVWHVGPIVDDRIDSIGGFSIIRQERNVNGGGVALFVRNGLKIKKLVSSDTMGLGKPGISEYLFCSVQRDDAATIKRLSEELSLQIIRHGPIHHTSSSHAWIELIMNDENDTILDSKNEWLPNFGKHWVIDVSLELYAPTPASDTFSYRDFKCIDTTSLVDLLSYCDWTAMNSIKTDLECTLWVLNNNIKLAIDELAPLKTLCPRRKYAPWSGPELSLLIDKSNATLRRYERTGRAELFDEALRLTNEVDMRSA